MKKTASRSRIPIVIAALVILPAIAAALMMFVVGRQWKGFSDPVIIEFPRGTSTNQMANMLAEKGVIQSAWMFKAARMVRHGETLQAGEYKFDQEASALDVYGRIARGDVYYIELLVPEGFNMFEIADAVAKLGTVTADQFLAEARDPGMISDIDPKAESLEGYLFPNTYHVHRKTTAREICRMMTNEFRTQWKNLARAQNSAAGMHDTVTLASLVEREARLPQERATVASVFQNRLTYNMRLGCDPTVVYAALLEGRYKGAIHQSDLDSDNPYNTYRHEGLPPGPIANPGLGSIVAALSPATTPYLYFVAKGDGSGGHTFTENLQKHEAAVAEYRRVLKSK